MLRWQDFADALMEQMVAILEAAPVLVGGIVIFALFWLGAAFVAAWTQRLSERLGVDAYLADVIGRILRYTLVLVGFVTALGTMGVDVTAMVAALGLVGFAVGFAFQDIIANFLAGMLIMLQQPFKPGDVVNVADLDGKVEEVRTRDTVMRTLDGRRAIIPNRSILNNKIINFTAYPTRRFSVEVGVSYDSDLSRVLAICDEIAVEMEGVVADPEPQVLVTEFAGSSINFEVRFWVDTRVRSFLLVRSDVVKRIKERFDDEGIEIPFPIRTVKLEKTQPVPQEG